MSKRKPCLDHEIGSIDSDDYYGSSDPVFMSKYLDNYLATELPDDKNKYCPECGTKINWRAVKLLVENNKVLAEEYKEKQRQAEQARFEALSPEDKEEELAYRKKQAEHTRQMSKLLKSAYLNNLSEVLEDNNTFYQNLK